MSRLTVLKGYQQLSKAAVSFGHEAPEPRLPRPLLLSMVGTAECNAALIHVFSCSRCSKLAGVAHWKEVLSQVSTIYTDAKHAADVEEKVHKCSPPDAVLLPKREAYHEASQSTDPLLCRSCELMSASICRNTSSRCRPQHSLGRMKTGLSLLAKSRLTWPSTPRWARKSI